MSAQKTIRARAPLRLGLAGGGTDVSPFSDRYGGHILNATIDLYAHAIIEPKTDGRLHFIAADQDETVEQPADQPLVDCSPLRLHRGIHRRIIRDFNHGKPLSLKLTTYADAPPGSGLGTSSTMVVAILQAYSEWLNLGLGEYEIAHLAFEIEREDLGMAGGKQDQYAASFGGFNFMEFGVGDRVLVNPLRVKDWVINELEASTVLYFTGTSRESASIIREQIDNTNTNNKESIDALLALKTDASALKEALLKGDLPRYSEILRQSWMAKRRIATAISNHSIDSLYAIALDAGATAGKISGAGGGGFMMLFVPPAMRMRVIRALSHQSGRVMNFHFTNAGAQSWVVPSLRAA